MVLSSVLVAVVAIGVGATEFVLHMVAQKAMYERDLAYMAEQTASIVTKEIDGKLSTLHAIAARPEISDPTVSTDKKVEVLASQVELAGSLRLNYIDGNGTVYSSDKTSFDASDRPYFIEGMKGNAYVADPLFTKLRGELVVIYAVPIKHNGQVVAVLSGTFDGNELGTIVNGNNFGKTGRAFMVNAEGTMIAHENIELVKQKFNSIEKAKEDESEKGRASFVKNMIEGKKQVKMFTADGVRQVIASAPVPGYSWFVGVQITKDEVYQDVDQMFISVNILAVFFILTGALVGGYAASRIAGRVTAVSEHMAQMATGDFTVKLSEDQLASKNEIGIMSVAIDEMQRNVGTMIATIKDTSEELANSSEALKTESGEIQKLSDVIASSINEIAQGTTAQATELVGINELLGEFNEQLNRMSEHVGNVEESSKTIDAMAAISSDGMEELNQSVAGVSASFEQFQSQINKLGAHIKEIHNITKIITDIANQTNLLALNASIEAARAGEFGKGFAVVAEEIGSLADQSKDATVSITQLIQGIAKDTESLIGQSGMMKEELDGQVGTIEQTIESFRSIIQEVNEIQPKIFDLKGSTIVIEQNKNIIIQKVDELSSVSEEISASSQEITASTEEMNGSIVHVADAASKLNDKTEEMMGQVEKFQID